jgi:hypothetical protein
MTTNNELIIPRIPEPPPEEWQQQDEFTWRKGGCLALFLDNDQAWSVLQQEDPGWMGPIGPYKTAEEAMCAVDMDTLYDDAQ